MKRLVQPSGPYRTVWTIEATFKHKPNWFERWVLRRTTKWEDVKLIGFPDDKGVPTHWFLEGGQVQTNGFWKDYADGVVWEWSREKRAAQAVADGLIQ